MLYLQFRLYRGGKETLYLGLAKLVNLNDIESVEINSNAGKLGQDRECPEKQVDDNLVLT